MKRRCWSRPEVEALGLHTTVETAASILGIGKTTAYDLIRRGDFPVQVLHLGGRKVVPVAPLLALFSVKEGS